MRKTIGKTMAKREVAGYSCYLCSGKMTDTKEIITKNGRLSTFNVRQCTQCGHSFSTLEESERIRKEINPSFLQRVKGIFSKDIEGLSIFKGRIL